MVRSSMTCIVPRTCRDIGEGNSRGLSESPARPLEEFEDRAAYVLLGAPGAGKTTTFEGEAESQGGICVTARNFLTLGDKPEWRNKTLFIDGLDETRAGAPEGLTSLDSIRTKLDRMGRPRFRLSCREADWFGANDRDDLKTVSPNGTVAVLRLDPLSEDDVRRILPANLGIENPEAFVAAAERRGLDGLLTNPKSLEMLAIAVGRGRSWPETRMQAFEMACRTLLVEHKRARRIAYPDNFSVSELMDACGRLCALQLLTGKAGYALPGEVGDQHFLGLDLLPVQDRKIFRTCLQTKLFHAPKGRQAFPVHRQIAEFLAARLLAGLVANGLPVRRILALIAGYDGVVISELRGLSAWLAAHSKSSRPEIIARDPLGTVLYGDAEHFSREEKRLILDGLRRETATNPALIATVQLDSRLGDLVSSDMGSNFREILDAPSRADSQQSFVALVIEALQHGERLPELGNSLIKLIRDGSSWPRIRLRAVQVFLRHMPDREKAFGELRTLTGDVYAGKVPDPDDALLGCLLSTLYPPAIGPSEIMQFLRAPQKPGNWLDYEYFWMGILPKRSTKDELILLLDLFADRYDQLRSEKDNAHELPASFVPLLPASLLTRVLGESNDDVDVARLFHWLGPFADAGDWTYDPDAAREDMQAIRRWLERRPSAWKALFGMGLKHCIDKYESTGPYGFELCMFKEERGRRLGASRPSDYGHWCLEQAIAAEHTTAAEWLLGEVATCLHHGQGDRGLSRDAVTENLADRAGLGDVFDKKLAELETRPSRERISEHRPRHRSKTKQPDWHEQLKPREGELREGNANPALLHELAKVYFGGYLNVRGKSRRGRLGALLAGDEGLVDAVLSGFRKTVERDDLPSDRQIIRLGASNRTHHLALPFMAGLEEKARTDPLGEVDIEDGLLRLALAVHYTVPMWPTAQHPADRPPRWFVWLVSARPDIVSDVLIRSVLSKLRSGAESPAGVYDLAHSTDHSRVAALASMEMLKRFPVRCASRQMSSLNDLLLAARRHCDTEVLRELIEKKCAQEDMSVAQRVHWLAAGLCMAPESYVDRLDAYVAGNERRVRFLAEAVTGQFIRSADLECCRTVAALELLVRLIGASNRPYSLGSDSGEGVMVTPEMNAADRVRGFVEQLAASPTEDSSRALAALSCDRALHPWQSFLVDAAHRQTAVRREAEFAYCGVARVLDTLERGLPANAADLAALTAEHLNEIARDIRDGNATGWRQYWNVDRYNRSQRPRPEDACRDSLLLALKERLRPLGIEVQPEGRYADNKRADIRISYGGYNVPVEIKRSCHRDVWSAMRSQLIVRYVRDPGTGGHGIYIVFWFDDTKDCRPTPPPTGSPVTDSREFLERLLSVLTAEERLKIQVCVFDVSDPEQLSISKEL